MKSKTIIFPAEKNLFFQTLTERVDGYFRENNIPRHADTKTFLKIIVLASILISAYTLMITYSTSLVHLLIFYPIMGVFTMLTGMNIGHDAIHNILVKKKKWNKYLTRVFDILGGNSYVWRIRHLESHHPYTNIPEIDIDVSQNKMVAIFDRTPVTKTKTYQHLYMPFVYTIYTLYWIFVRDIGDFFRHDYGKTTISKHPSKEIVILIFSKLVYLTIFVFVPMYMLDLPWQYILIGFIAMHVTASITTSLSLLSSHVSQEVEFPEPDENGNMENSWAVHQLVTTCDFSTRNPVFTYLFAAFNHHVVHHLFPKVSHAHYPVLTEILKETAAEFGLPYNEHPSLYVALRSHYLLLKNQGVKRYLALSDF